MTLDFIKKILFPELDILIKMVYTVSKKSDSFVTICSNDYRILKKI